MTGKSVLGRRLSGLCGGQFFQRLLTRFTSPEEIFGPLSLKALENDEYRRCTSGFLPTAAVAFLDEIFKANSSILNTLVSGALYRYCVMYYLIRTLVCFSSSIRLMLLHVTHTTQLTILNERKFDNGPGVRQDCPVRCVVGASNELPEDEELDALYDRFLIRKEVKPVSDDGLMQLLSVARAKDDEERNGVSKNHRIFTDRLDEVAASLSKDSSSVAIPGKFE